MDLRIRQRAWQELFSLDGLPGDIGFGTTAMDIMERRGMSRKLNVQNRFIMFQHEFRMSIKPVKIVLNEFA